jgi:putative alpha-1,2-mannosidase
MDVKSNHSQIQSHIFINGLGAGINSTFLRSEDNKSKNPAVMLRFTPLAASEEVLVRMGTSFISHEQACSNAEEEIPDFEFDSVSESSVSQFETLLNRIRVDTTNVTDETLTLFYSSVRLC